MSFALVATMMADVWGEVWSRATQSHASLDYTWKEGIWDFDVRLIPSKTCSGMLDVIE